MERDGLTDMNGNKIFISTHTLTWSVTLKMITNGKWEIISTHTLTWSVT